MRQRFYAWLVKDIMPDEYKWPLEIYVEGLAEFKSACRKQLGPILEKLGTTLDECFENYYKQL